LVVGRGALARGRAARAAALEGKADMTALIITETCFGNTAAVADAIAQALAGPGRMRVQALAVAEAPAQVPPGTELLILAAPTHDYSLPRRGTRAHAVPPGQAGEPAAGLREWIAAAAPLPGLKVVTVDTALHLGVLPSSASKSAARLLRRAGFKHVHRGATFYVTDCAGPLEDGETVRAREWATALAAETAETAEPRAREWATALAAETAETAETAEPRARAAKVL
jgi:hypothetical protein